MKKLLKNIGFVLVIFLFISALVILYSAPQTKPKDISLSELVTQINEGTVRKIAVSENELAIDLQDGSTEKATKEKEAGLTESLKNFSCSAFFRQSGQSNF